MRFDWMQFCRSHHIEFVESGPNTARGNISIKCPFCGNADSSQHMGLKLDVRDPQWGCFRRAEHRGKHPAFLISKLLGITFKAAADMVGAGATPIDDYDRAMETLKNGPETAKATSSAGPRVVTLPKDFRALERTGYKVFQFLQYLAVERGFGDAAESVASEWNLYYALTGEQAWRVIFPVGDKNANLLGWTGRAISKDAVLRYRASENLGKDAVYAYPHPYLRNSTGGVLAIVEGPMDALKLNAFTVPGLHAIATMGTSFTDGQLLTILEIMGYYKRTVIVGDRGALSEAMQLSEHLSTFAQKNIPVIQLPGDFKDPGAMPKDAIESFTSSLIK